MLWLALIPMLSSALFLSMTNNMFILEWSIMNIMSSDITFPLIIDATGVMFSSTVIFISANVIYFADFYMQDEVFKKRFIHLVLSFVLSMNFLIFIPHLMGLLLGWDGLGITSFILVIYYQNPKSLAAGMITALTNRIGDVMILLSITWCLNQGHWMIINMNNSNMDNMITMCILIAAMTKSAQMPFSSWLPAAMAAPTPVSALVHSSTLVTAGVFLLIRFYPFLSKSLFFNYSLMIISSLTMFMAGAAALFETDLKKIIALSTLSQLGVMMASISLNLPNLALFHLFTHAIFKALLFLCAGSLIHLHHHGQDLRMMGNIFSQLPLTTSCMTIANMALCGLPFMAGFYSKDLIIEMALFNPNNIVILSLLLAATLMTASYSIRLMFTSIMSMNMSLPIQYISESNKSMINPMSIMTLGAIAGGAMFNWIMFVPFSEPVITPYMKLAALILTVAGMIFVTFSCSSYNLYTHNLHLTHHSNSFMWFLVPLASQATIKHPLMFGHSNTKIIDQGWTELMSAQGIFSLTSTLASSLQLWQNSKITIHLSIMLLFLIIMNIM
uniref:NADH-ubiquinone oxidoreductase chain 5 n=1 Tax=Glycinde armigera TaxID=397552 RepID=A0A0U2W3L1_9ANNE|nr:NADH dehydrogenase subunit 5 [Glycinde armigera]